MLARITAALADPAIPAGSLEYTIRATAKPTVKNPPAYFDATLRDCITRGGPPALPQREGSRERKAKAKAGRNGGIPALELTGKDLDTSTDVDIYTDETPARSGETP